MKYFEFVEPYYALIKSLNKEDALIKYNELISDTEEVHVKEVSKDYAFENFFNALVRARPAIETKEVKALFLNNDLLLVDGNLE